MAIVTSFRTICKNGESKSKFHIRWILLNITNLGSLHEDVSHGAYGFVTIIWVG